MYSRVKTRYTFARRRNSPLSSSLLLPRSDTVGLFLLSPVNMLLFLLMCSSQQQQKCSSEGKSTSAPLCDGVLQYLRSMALPGDTQHAAQDWRLEPAWNQKLELKKKKGGPCITYHTPPVILRAAGPLLHISHNSTALLCCCVARSSSAD